jgi:hypothetical protein
MDKATVFKRMLLAAAAQEKQAWDPARVAPISPTPRDLIRAVLADSALNASSTVIDLVGFPSPFPSLSIVLSFIISRLPASLTLPFPFASLLFARRGVGTGGGCRRPRSCTGACAAGWTSTRTAT